MIAESQPEIRNPHGLTTNSQGFWSARIHLQYSRAESSGSPTRCFIAKAGSTWPAATLSVHSGLERYDLADAVALYVVELPRVAF